MSNPILIAKDINLSFGGVVAADHIDFELHAECQREDDECEIPQFEVELRLPTVPVMEERNETV